MRNVDDQPCADPVRKGAKVGQIVVDGIELADMA